MPAASDTVISGFLNGVPQFNGTTSISLVDQISALEQRAQANNNAVLLRQVRQVSQAFQEYTLGTLDIANTLFYSEFTDAIPLSNTAAQSTRGHEFIAKDLVLCDCGLKTYKSINFCLQ